MAKLLNENSAAIVRKVRGYSVKLAGCLEEIVLLCVLRKINCFAFSLVCLFICWVPFFISA